MKIFPRKNLYDIIFPRRTVNHCYLQYQRGNYVVQSLEERLLSLGKNISNAELSQTFIDTLSRTDQPKANFVVPKHFWNQERLLRKGNGSRNFLYISRICTFALCVDFVYSLSHNLVKGKFHHAICQDDKLKSFRAVDLGWDSLHDMKPDYFLKSLVLLLKVLDTGSILLLSLGEYDMLFRTDNRNILLDDSVSQ